MPNWKEVLEEIQTLAKSGQKDALDVVRRKYLAKIQSKTGRNVIAYYSGWLQKPQQIDTIVNDKDKNALMVNIHKLDRTNGLDLILHTPGGDFGCHRKHCGLSTLNVWLRHQSDNSTNFYVCWNNDGAFMQGDYYGKAVKSWSD